MKNLVTILLVLFCCTGLFAQKNNIIVSPIMSFDKLKNQVIISAEAEVGIFIKSRYIFGGYVSKNLNTISNTTEADKFNASCFHGGAVARMYIIRDPRFLDPYIGINAGAGTLNISYSNNDEVGKDRFIVVTPSLGVERSMSRKARVGMSLRYNIPYYINNKHVEVFNNFGVSFFLRIAF